MRQKRLKQTFLTPDGAGDEKAAPTRVTRKRATQLGERHKEDEPKKRIKDERNRVTPEKKVTKGRSKRFSFPTDVSEVEAETPKFPPKLELEADVEMKAVSEESDTGNSSATTSDSVQTDGSVSIRAVGSTTKRISKAKPKRGRKTKAANPKASDLLAKAYLDFRPEEAATWKAGKQVPYRALTETFLAIESTTKRLEITQHLTQLFRCILETTPEDLLPAVYLCVNKVGPAHEGLELGIGDSILMKAIANVSGGGDTAKIKKQYEEDGDLGSVAVSRKRGQVRLMDFQDLTVHEVFKKFLEIAKDTGDKSQERKRKTIERLLNASRDAEAKFITRSLQGKLRIGLAEQTVLQAVGQAFHMTVTPTKDLGTLMQRMEKSVERVKQAYSQCPSYDQLIPSMIKYGVVDIEKRLTFAPGVPVQPMLAKPTTGVSEVLDKFADIRFTCEFKYDGERSQIHVLADRKVLIYSRNAENVTGKYPDIAQRIPQYLKPNVTSVVLDCESVAYDIEAKKILPFQRLSTRARKDVTFGSIKVPVCVFCFDCLFLNGQSLLEKPLTERREALYSAVTTEPGIIQFAEHQTSSNVEELQLFLDLAVRNSTEGLIVKTLDCSYEPSKRSVNWLKLKKDYLEGVGDSFDLVVIGAWHGKGKRTGVFGSFLLAVYDPINDEYQSISKIGTGFSEEDLENHSKALKDIEIAQAPSNYRFGETAVPDTWFDAKVVWEVKAADLSISPVHQAASGVLDDTKGISIRFPRLIRVRDDKTATDATTSDQVVEMYKSQRAVQEPPATAG